LKIVFRDADPNNASINQNLTIIAENHYMNYSFIVELSFLLDNDDDSDKNTEVEIIWIIILVIGVAMIIGLLFVWRRQAKSDAVAAAQSGDQSGDRGAIHQSLLTDERVTLVEPQTTPNQEVKDSEIIKEKEEEEVKEPAKEE
jgi:hypothetical protein